MTKASRRPPARKKGKDQGVVVKSRRDEGGSKAKARRGEPKTMLEKERDRKVEVLYGSTGSRGLSKVTDKRLKTEMKHSEKRSRDAALGIVRSEMLLPDEAGFLETEGPMEKTHKVTQKQIWQEADIQTASNIFDLNLKEFGPYRVDYTRNGRHFVLAGQRGHVAMLDALRMEVVSEFHLRETVRDVKFLHNETMLAVAQKKYLYIYDQQGVELHCLKQHVEPQRLDFLPYHFLLVSVGRAGWLKYHDVSTGQLVAEHGTKRGGCRTMRQNPYNAIMHLGHSTGVVTLWSPTVSTPLVSLLCHQGPVLSLAVHGEGKYMATAGGDGRVRIWDLRTYKMLHGYQFSTAASSLDISQRGLLGIGFGSHVHVWKDALAHKVQSPYMRHEIPGSWVEGLRFRPYEDVLGVGHRNGFSSLVIPGAGEPNFDTLEANPFQSRKQRREGEVHNLLDKLQPDMISLDPAVIGTVDRQPDELRKELRELVKEADRRPAKLAKEKNRMRGKNKIGKKLKRRQQNVIDQKMLALREEMEATRKQSQKEKEGHRQERMVAATAPALQRFFKNNK